MKKVSKTEQRVAHTLEQMRKAMPEIKRQVEVYEKSVKSGTQIKSPKVAPQFRNV
ncbi:MAG: hypothetical protein P4L41_09375 [Flavipsychrobacter sp.]|nr:hypothetical protein [Flavipsychrobacter sp.]